MQSRYRRGHKVRFTIIKGGRLSVRHSAEITISGTFVAEYKEGSSAPGGTFPLVGASGFSANRMKTLSIGLAPHL
jgi:hypothetical protein